MTHPNQFFIQRISQSNDSLKKLVEDMTQYYESEENQKLHALKEVGENSYTNSTCHFITEYSNMIF